MEVRLRQVQRKGCMIERGGSIGGRTMGITHVCPTIRLDPLLSKFLFKKNFLWDSLYCIRHTSDNYGGAIKPEEKAGFHLISKRKKEG